MMTIPRYKIPASYCRRSHQNGGTVIYAKWNYEVQVLAVDRFSSEMHIECSGIKLNFNNINICVLSLYRPPRGDIDVFFTNFCSLVNFISTDNVILYIYVGT